jgi:hypothetical protein
MKIINLTPHAINLPGITVPPSGQLARCQETVKTVDQIEVEGAVVPVVEKTFGDVTGLPEPVWGTIYIVSALVAQAVRRSDVFCPGDPVRDTEGKIIGCKSLCRI